MEHATGFFDCNLDAAEAVGAQMHAIKPLTFDEVHFTIAILMERAALAGLCQNCLLGVFARYPSVYAKARTMDLPTEGTLQ